MDYNNLYLPEKTALAKGRYLTGRVLSAGSDGVTYLGFDTERKLTVTIREFLPGTICIRKENSAHLLIKSDKKSFYDSCLAAFLDMWRKLARMRGLSALIPVIDIIEENNTAYAVCEHIENAITVKKYLESKEDGFIQWNEARVLFMPVLQTLATLHSAGIIHRGISPETLIIGPDRKVRLSGFSIAECRNAGTGLDPEIFDGYAPVEQYGVAAPSGPWTDIYAFAAVLFRALTGITPIPSTVRMKEDRLMIPARFAKVIPAFVINALINALQIMPEDRTKTVEQFREELSSSPTAAMAASYEVEPVSEPDEDDYDGEEDYEEEERPRRRTGEEIKRENRKTAIKAAGIAGGVALFLFIILCVTVLKGHFGGGKNNKPSGDETSTKAPVSSDVKVQVPTFTGRTYTNIASQKSYFDDFVITTKEEYSTEVNRGYVISQSIEAGTEVGQGTEIELVISLGVEQAEMIDVVGEKYEDAEAKLKEAGFTNIKIIYMTNDGTHEKDTVASSMQKVGELYDKTEKITLTVYSEAPTTTEAAEEKPEEG